MEQHFYDATLKALTDTEAVFTWQGRDVRRPRPAHAASLREQEVGQIGVLVVNESSGYFYPYLEQRLRRAMQYDEPETHLWAWQLTDAAQPVFVSAGVIPGLDGKVIEDDTTALTIAVPREFDDLCASLQLDAESVLRGFIADACRLQNCSKEPREDGYSSNGSEVSGMARDYLDRAYRILQMCEIKESPPSC